MLAALFLRGKRDWGRGVSIFCGYRRLRTLRLYVLPFLRVRRDFLDRHNCRRRIVGRLCKWNPGRIQRQFIALIITHAHCRLGWVVNVNKSEAVAAVAEKRYSASLASGSGLGGISSSGSGTAKSLSG